jgi:pimeloyl-ACP methyl ester carboxylesterase
MPEIGISTGDAVLLGDLHLPDNSRSVVVFAHGSGSSRFSPRNRHVAEALHAAGLGTLLMDLLTPEEERIDARTATLRFDIELLGRRTMATVEALAARDAGLLIGCFGASTGAAAALVAAAERPELVRSVVSRGGRPDLAGSALEAVRAPTLLIVGGRDERVLALNQQVMSRMRCEVRLEIVPGATHLFEEPGALEAVSRLAIEWFSRHLAPA